jgi:hypothetical protein
VDHGQLRRILEDMEPGMAFVVPIDWVSLNIEGDDETQRDLNTIEVVTSHGCSWERDPDTRKLTFLKQPPAE